MDEVSDAAVIVASPPDSATVPSTPARVVWFKIVIANEPATDTLPPPAPATDCAPNVAVWSAPSMATVAAAVKSCAVIVTVAGTTARFVTFASVIATAAPMVASDPCDAAPFADVDASAFVAEVRETEPVAVTAMPDARIVSARTVDRVMAIAAATFTLPEEDSGSGVVALPAPSPPCADDVAPAWVRSPST